MWLNIFHILVYIRLLKDVQVEMPISHETTIKQRNLGYNYKLQLETSNLKLQAVLLINLPGFDNLIDLNSTSLGSFKYTLRGSMLTTTAWDIGVSAMHEKHGEFMLLKTRENLTGSLCIHWHHENRRYRLIVCDIPPGFHKL